MTGFIIFRDVVLNLSDIQYVMVKDVKRKRDEDGAYLMAVTFKNDTGVTFPYVTEKEATEALHEFCTILAKADEPPKTVSLAEAVLATKPETT